MTTTLIGESSLSPFIRAQHYERGTDAFTLTVVVPAYNETARLARSLPVLLDHLQARPESCRVLVVDDGSTDGTADAVRALMPARPELDLISLARQQGKGAAVRVGMLASHSDVIGFMDADLSTSLAHIDQAVTKLERGSDVVIGSRALPSSHTVTAQPPYRRLGARVFREITRVIGAVPNTPDAQCGFKLFRGAVAHDLFASSVIDRWMFDLEILRLALHRNYKVSQIPVKWTNDPDSRLRLTLDTLRMVRDLARIRWRFWMGRYDNSQRTP